MSKSYDVYMCRFDKRKETEKQLPDAYTLRSSDDIWSYWASKVARDGFLMVGSDGTIARKKGA
jgi:hypothetical protein